MTTSKTIERELVLAFLPIAPATLSIISSALLLRMTAGGKRSSSHGHRNNSRRHHHRPFSPYRRLLFALSFFDIINSIRIALGPFLLPSNLALPYQWWVVGNHATCTMLGCLTQLTVPAYTYYSALMVYFLWRIRFSKTQNYHGDDGTFYARCEKWIHLGTLIYVLLTMILGLALDLFGAVSFGNGCWIVPNPDIGCGKKCVVIVQWLFGGIPFLGTFLVALVTNFWIVVHVRTTSRKTSSMNPEHKTQQFWMVATQATLYVLVFYLVYIWTLVIRIMAMAGRTAEDEEHLFPLFLVRALFHPLLGFGNLLVYIRPRYCQLRFFNPHKTRLWALQRVFVAELSPSSCLGRWCLSAAAAANDGDARLQSSTRDRISSNGPRRLHDNALFRDSKSDDSVRPPLWPPQPPHRSFSFTSFFFSTRGLCYDDEHPHQHAPHERVKEHDEEGSASGPEQEHRVLPLENSSIRSSSMEDDMSGTLFVVLEQDYDESETAAHESIHAAAADAATTCPAEEPTRDDRVMFDNDDIFSPNFECPVTPRDEKQEVPSSDDDPSSSCGH